MSQLEGSHLKDKSIKLSEICLDQAQNENESGSLRAIGKFVNSTRDY